MALSADCYTCAQEAEAEKLPPREFIAADDHWRVAHAFGTGMEGWLVLLPRRHVTSISELNDAEAQSLGIWQVRLSQALHHVLGCQKTYIAQFAEAAGFSLSPNKGWMKSPASCTTSLRNPPVATSANWPRAPHASGGDLGLQDGAW